MRAVYLIAALLTLAGCGSPAVPPAGERSALVDALRLLPDHPEQAIAICRTIGHHARPDCILATVEAAPEHALATDWCAELRAVSHDECFFQIAERTKNLPQCDRAGRFVDDCRLHVWSRQVARSWEPTNFAESTERARRDLGPLAEDDRFWIATFRHALGRQAPLDRGACLQLEDRESEVCRQAGIDLFNDRLNWARDRSLYPCDGGVLPVTLRHTADPELDALRVRRQHDDLCGGAAGGIPPARAPH